MTVSIKLGQTRFLGGESMPEPSLYRDDHHDYGSTSSQQGKYETRAAAAAAATAAGDDDSIAGSSSERQAGVQTMEGISRAWTSTSLAVAYVGLYLMVFTTSLQGQTTVNLTAFATSTFKAHSQISTVNVVQGVFLSVVKPPMAKIANVFGRLEAFCMSVALFMVGYIQMAASDNVQTYASAQLFYAAGSTGLQIVQQIFIADTSNLLNRALFSSIPDLPFVVTVWCGPPLADYLIAHASWRWGYAIWVVILPIVFCPLGLSLFLNQRRARKMGLVPESKIRGRTLGYKLRYLWFELDFFGLLLLSAAECLILIPLTLAASAKNGWRNSNIIGMLVIGSLCLCIFPFWERSPRLAPKAFFPRPLFRTRSVIVGITIALFYFMAFYLSVQPYFYSYLLVVQSQSITSAGRITSIFSFSATITAFVVSFLIKYTRRYKYWVTLGSCVYMLGLGLMARYRQESASLGQLIMCQTIVGIGGGLVNIPVQLGVQAAVSHENVAAATAIFLTVLEIGGAIGASISGAVWSNNLLPKLTKYLPPESRGLAAEIYGNVTLASEGWPVGSPTRVAINRSYQETLDILLAIAICVCIPVIILSFFMQDLRLDQIDQRVKGRVIGGTGQHAGCEEDEEDDGIEHNEESEQIPDGHSHTTWLLWPFKAQETRRRSLN